jgi:hypothetical protein
VSYKDETKDCLSGDESDGPVAASWDVMTDGSMAASTAAAKAAQRAAEMASTPAVN